MYPMYLSAVAVARRWSEERGGASAYVAAGVLVLGTLSAVAVITGAFDAVAARIQALVDLFAQTQP